MVTLPGIRKPCRARVSNTAHAVFHRPSGFLITSARKSAVRYALNIPYWRGCTAGKSAALPPCAVQGPWPHLPRARDPSPHTCGSTLARYIASISAPMTPRSCSPSVVRRPAGTGVLSTDAPLLWRNCAGSTMPNQPCPRIVGRMEAAGVAATLNYLAPGSTRNRLYVAPGGHFTTTRYDPRSVWIANGRRSRDDFGLDRSGFTMLDHARPRPGSTPCRNPARTPGR